MKKVLGLLIAPESIISCTNEPNGYKIHGEITGATHTLVKLYKVEGNNVLS